MAFTSLALILFLPSTPFKTALPAFWTNGVPHISLGLDLQGGMHLVLEVDQEQAIETHVKRLAASTKGLFKDKKVPVTYVKATGVDTLAVAFPSGLTSKARDKIKDLMKEEVGLFDAPTLKGNRFEFRLAQFEKDRIKDWSTSQALETLRNRIDQFGVSEPIIQRQGPRQIVIQLPGIKDTQRAIKLIGDTAVLEFRMLDENGSLSDALAGKVPFGSEILYQRVVDDLTGEETERIPYLVQKEVLLTGDVVEDARVQFDQQMNAPYVGISFDRQGAKIFEDLTAANVGKRMAIILDGNVYTAPNIRERIGGGSATITGGFNSDTAADLAIVLRAGALPAPVDIIQNVTVGPTLGQDSIDAGQRAMMLGAVFVIAFMIIYYKVSGLIALWAVFLNIIMLMGAMSYFSATLTLPGIAGILLTVGMGVDANVLIFERIKEELRAGRTPRSSVNAGYDHAWWTIVDSQVTTLITAAVLFQFGSGPIKGFAVTLSLGIIINLFTALVGTKVIFDIRNRSSRVGKVSI